MKQQTVSLLKLLSDNAFHSGDEVAEHLGVTRAAVSKWVKALNEEGINVHSVKGKGYQLSQHLCLLEEVKLQQALAQRVELIVSQQTESTNDDVKQAFSLTQPKLVKPLLALTERQTRGRGRRGRDWVSPYAENLYMTLGLELELAIAQLSGLSIAVGLSIANTLKGLGFDAQLKWPNDVYLQGKKLAGILVELEGGFDSPCRVIIGIGLNVNMRKHDKDASSKIDQPWLSLAEYVGEVIDRNELTIALVNNLLKDMQDFVEQGLNEKLAEWRNFDTFYQQKVSLEMPNNKITGICMGIDSQGALLLKCGDEIKHFIGGEISVRKQSVN